MLEPGERMSTQDFIFEFGGAPDEYTRSSIRNLDVPLAYREKMAIEIAEDMDFNNIKFPKSYLVTEKGKPVGVMFEWESTYLEEEFYIIKGAQGVKNARTLTDAETIEMTAYDYLIGNTDRHWGNVMRHKTKGTPLMIDHGYAMPAQTTRHSFTGADIDDLDAESFLVQGLQEWDCKPAVNIRNGMQYNMSSEEYMQLAENLNDLDVASYARKYGLSNEEWQAMEARRRVLHYLIESDEFTNYLQAYYANGKRWPDIEEYGFDTQNWFIDLTTNWKDVVV
jgi:hypothetical protein